MRIDQETFLLDPIFSTGSTLLTSSAQAVSGAKTFAALAIFTLGARFDTAITSGVAADANAVALKDSRRLHLAVDTGTDEYFYAFPSVAPHFIITPAGLSICGSTGSFQVRRAANAFLIADPDTATLTVNTGSGGGKIEAGSDIETVTVGKGFILKSPNGTRYRISVDNAGALSAVSI